MMAEGKWIKLTSSGEIITMDEYAVRQKIPNLEKKIMRASRRIGNFNVVARAGDRFWYGHETSDL